MLVSSLMIANPGLVPLITPAKVAVSDALALPIVSVFAFSFTSEVAAPVSDWTA